MITCVGDRPRKLSRENFRFSLKTGFLQQRGCGRLRIRLGGRREAGAADRARERCWRDQAKEEIRMRVDPVVRVRDGCAGSD